jgi:hypothetical protein
MREGAFVVSLEIGNWRMEEREKRRRKRTKGGKILMFTWYQWKSVK